MNSTALLKAAGAKIRYETSKPKGDIAVAWGNRTPPAWSRKVRWINIPSAIPLVADKMNWSKLCAKHGFGPKFTTDKDEAITWAKVKNAMVLCRTKLNASGGAGIVVARSGKQVVDAPLYSQYFSKQREYRVVFGPQCGFVYSWSKRRPEDHEFDRDQMLIRTTDMGWVYQWEEEEDVPPAVYAAVIEVADNLSALGLRCLAYDVAYNTTSDEACIIEANTAWGVNEETAGLTLAAFDKVYG